jgi:hypothetical protein
MNKIEEIAELAESPVLPPVSDELEVSEIPQIWPPRGMHRVIDDASNPWSSARLVAIAGLISS